MTDTPQHDAAAGKGRPIWERAFLSALAEVGVVRYACRSANVDSATVYRRRDVDEEFRDAWAVALEEAADALEEAAVARARDGYVECVVSRNGEIRENRKYSDLLLIFLLKGARPDKYRERSDVRVSDLPDVSSVITAAHAAATGGSEGESE